MIAVSYRNHGIKITDVWFPNEDWKTIKTDIIRLHGIENTDGITSENSNLQHTLLIDLTNSEEELWNSIKRKNYKYEIRRSEKDGIQIEHYKSKTLAQNAELLEQFKRCYDQMFLDKRKSIALNLLALKK